MLRVCGRLAAGFPLLLASSLVVMSCATQRDETAARLRDAVAEPKARAASIAGRRSGAEDRRRAWEIGELHAWSDTDPFADWRGRAARCALCHATDPAATRPTGPREHARTGGGSCDVPSSSGHCVERAECRMSR